ncbi:MAG: helix-turn-helix domain-containing protein [Pirellulales bacterium]
MSRPRSAGTNLLRWLAESTAPVYAVDEQRCILYANTAVEAWLGVDAEMLHGTRCDYHSPNASDSPDAKFLAAALCPPPTSFTGTRCSGLLVVRTASGVTSRRSCEYLPLPGESGELFGVLVIVASLETDESGSLESMSGEDSPEQLHQRLQNARQSWWERFQLDRLVGDSPAIRKAREQAQWASEGRARVVVSGPQGSGRESLLRTIHRGSQSLPPPVVTWDAALLDDELLKRALEALVRGRTENPTPATVIVKEIDRLAPESQHRLADFLLSTRYPPRILATSSEPLASLARAHKFRPELAAWLGTVEIELPPLRQRLEDIPLLTQAAIERWNSRGKKQLSGANSESLELLTRYSWPGEARELFDLVIESCGRCLGTIVTVDDLPPLLRHAASAARIARPEPPVNLDKLLLEMEKEVIRRALRNARGNRARAARALGISRPRLLRRIEQLGLAPPSSPE